MFTECLRDAFIDASVGAFPVRESNTFVRAVLRRDSHYCIYCICQIIRDVPMENINDRYERCA